jgi:hypothetical protein
VGLVWQAPELPICADIGLPALVDILINNLGIFEPKPFEQIENIGAAFSK